MAIIDRKLHFGIIDHFFRYLEQEFMPAYECQATKTIACLCFGGLDNH